MLTFDIFKPFQFSFRRKYNDAKRLLVTSLNATIGYASFIPDHLVIAPQDLRTCDLTIAKGFASGQYTLGGHSLIAYNGENPFQLKTDNILWNQELHQFNWLQHFKIEDNSIPTHLAQTLVKQWIGLNPAITADFQWNIEIASRRLISWLCHSITILRNTDSQFHDDFMHSIGLHLRYLRRFAATTTHPDKRFLAYTALMYAALCREDIPSNFNLTERKFFNELEQQVLPDGGHKSRNSKNILQILLLLLPLKEAYSSRQLQSPEKLEQVISRLFPALHFFRLGDGNFARFNGSGITERDLLITILRYDEKQNKPILSAPDTGYERMEMGESVLLMDTGAALDEHYAESCHAGCLSFEFSSGTHCIIVNTGTPYDASSFKQSVWRQTSEHSTIVMNNTSSCKFGQSAKHNDLYSGPLFSNKLRVSNEREYGDNTQTIIASHLGYVREFGARHERKVTLDKNGKRLCGKEWFSGPDKSNLKYSTKDEIKANFHLHQEVSACMSDDGKACILTLRDGKQWKFTAEGFTIKLEDSKYFSNLSGPRKIMKIVVSAKISNTPEVSWALEEIQ